MGTPSAAAAHLPPMIPISTEALAADPAVHTAYLTSGGGSVAMIDTRTCNSGRTVGCAQTPPEVTLGQNPSGIAVNPGTHTVYVADAGAGSTGTVTVLDDRICNATKQTGCPDIKTLRVPGGNPKTSLSTPRPTPSTSPPSPAAAPTWCRSSTASPAMPRTPAAAVRRPRPSRSAAPATRRTTPVSTSPSTGAPTRSTHQMSSTPRPANPRRSSATRST